MKILFIDRSDENIELIPEGYIESKIPSLKDIEWGVEELVKSCACYIIKNKNE